MKKTAAILLLCLMVFNTTGYRLVVQWMQQQQSSQLNRQLDAASYDEASLIELTVPLLLPYYNNWGYWERHEGEIQVNGQTYQYVKRKIEGGRLLLKCLPNPQQQVIQSEISNAFAQLNGLSIAENGTSKSIKQPVKAMSMEYMAAAFLSIQTVTGTSVQKPDFPLPVLLPAISVPSPEQPPEEIS